MADSDASHPFIGFIVIKVFLGVTINQHQVGLGGGGGGGS